MIGPFGASGFVCVKLGYGLVEHATKLIMNGRTDR